ncbi:hypothetical protein [Spiroplasma poulsonii]|nr:hypothetical protein [Spiroplasma poulsonii]
MLFSQSVFVLFLIAFSVDSSIMIRKILLIFKKHNIRLLAIPFFIKILL